MNLNAVKGGYDNLLYLLGLNRGHENFRETPMRVARFWNEFLNREEPDIKVFPSDSTELIKLNGYETWGLCPHHLLPVKYKVDVAYIPKGKVFGISKLPRIVDYLLRTLPLQEDLPKLVVDYIYDKIDIEYAECFVEGMHLCMIMRGIKAKDVTLTTFHAFDRRGTTQVLGGESCSTQ
jgi:GTP cyclohydrolase I